MFGTVKYPVVEMLRSSIVLLVFLVTGLACDTPLVDREEEVLTSSAECRARLYRENTFALRFENTLDLPIDSIEVRLYFQSGSHPVLDKFWFDGLNPGETSCYSIIPRSYLDSLANPRSYSRLVIKSHPFVDSWTEYSPIIRHGHYTFQIVKEPWVFRNLFLKYLTLDDDQSSSVEVRIINEFPFPLEDIWVRFPDTTVVYGNVASGDSTRYVDVASADRPVRMSLVAEGVVWEIYKDDTPGIVWSVQPGRYSIRFVDEQRWWDYSVLIRDD